MRVLPVAKKAIYAGAALVLFAALAYGSLIDESFALTIDARNLWPRGAELKVCFYNGGANVRKFVATTASEWTKHGNIKFNFGNPPAYQSCESADFFSVSVLFSDNQSWTFPGPKAAEAVSRNNPTMTLGILGTMPENDVSTRRIVLHEFGHLLGFVHEEQNPKLDCLNNLDRDAVADSFNITVASAHSMIGPHIDPSRVIATDPDPVSIMTLNIPAQFISRSSGLDRCSTTTSFELSALDKKGMSLAYPGGVAAKAVVTVEPPRTDLRRLLDQRIEFGNKLISLVGDMTNTLPSVTLPDNLQDLDPDSTQTLIALSNMAAKAVIEKSLKPRPPFIEEYLAGRYSEAYESALEPASKGVADAAILLADMNLERLGRTFDLDNAIRWIRTAAEKKSPDGALILGFAYRYGLGVPRDAAMALKHYQDADKANHPVATHMLGLLYFFGQGVQQDYKAARLFFTRASNQGFVLSQRAVAIMSDQGLGGDRDPVKAFDLSRVGAAAGDVPSLLLLGLFHADGTGTTPDFVQALKYLQNAAVSGAALPNAVMGMLYDTGSLKVPRNRQKAIEHYASADNLKSGLVWYRLAELLLQGDPSEQAQAVAVFRKAAEVGQVSAQFKLAEFYREGFGSNPRNPAALAAQQTSGPDTDPYPVPKNLTAALGWFTIAALYASGSQQEVASREAQAISRKVNRADWVVATEFAMARVRRWEGFLQQTAANAPPGATSRELATEIVKSTGSGVIIGRKGHILTNAHVVKGCTSVRVTANGQEDKAKVLFPNDAVDLAVLKIDYAPGFAAKFRIEPIIGSEKIVVMGYPQPAVFGVPHLVSQPGEVTALTGIGDDPNVFQTSATINPGNSGGPVYDVHGNLTGIAASRVRPDVLQNTNFAIKSSIAKNYLESHSLPVEQGGTVENLSFEKIGEQNERYLAYVECLGPPAQIAVGP